MWSKVNGGAESRKRRGGAVLVCMRYFGSGGCETALGVVLTMFAVYGMVPVRSFCYFGCYGFVVGTALYFLLLGIPNAFLEHRRLNKFIK